MCRQIFEQYVPFLISRRTLCFYFEARAHEVAEKILEAISAIRNHIDENCDNVGADFAEEARRIHYGEAEQRGISGTATEDEVGKLDEEGVEFYRLPTSRRKN